MQKEKYESGKTKVKGEKEEKKNNAHKESTTVTDEKERWRGLFLHPNMATSLPLSFICRGSPLIPRPVQSTPC